MQSASTNPPLLLNKFEVAALLGVSVRSFMGLVAKRQGPPHIVIGKQFRWSRQWVEEWVESQRNSPEQATRIKRVRRR